MNLVESVSDSVRILVSGRLIGRIFDNLIRAFG